jgi:hypothetical protein
MNSAKHSMHPVQRLSKSFKAVCFTVLLLLLSVPANSLGNRKKSKKVKPELTSVSDLPYTIVADSVYSNNTWEIHQDTILTKKYSLKKIIASYDLIPDTSWQSANVYAVNYDTLFHYDYVAADPVYSYTGKIKMIKPYRFFRPSEVQNKPRIGFVTGLIGGLYAGANAWWSSAWYSKFERDKFHFFNDWGEWNQMDKLGHVYSTYLESKLTYDLYRWAGVQEKHAIWIGMLMGNVWQMSIEINDGFQKKWGFSWPDFTMNLTGSLLFGVQQYIWHDQRIQMKFSAFPVNYNKYDDPELKARADKLYGTSFSEILLKDYNSQTYWWSVAPGAFIRNPNSKFPKCLQVSFGYGASGMFGGFKNRWSKNDLSGDQDLDDVDPADIIDRSDIQRLKRFYFSFDIDWTKLPVKKHWAKGLMKVLNVIKLPAPAIEFNNNKNGSKVAWHWLKF